MLRMGRWQPMREPLNPDREIFSTLFHSGISLGASFADEATQYTEGKIGMIPCADGGTRIDQWKEGSILFDHAVMMTRLAMRTSHLAGILWHQGEGRALMAAALSEILKKLPCEVLTLHAQCHAVGFYEKFGFETYSEPFIEEEILHVTMQKHVACEG